jgi:TrmH family RNA methyltransferase
MQKISSASTPSGILAIFKFPDLPSLSLDHNNPPLVLANIQDPGNLGTLLRSAAAFNKKNIILINGVDVWNPKVIQASAGTLALINIYQYTWPEVLILKKHFKLGALVIKEGKRPEEINYSKTILIIGNEAHGLPQEWQNECDIKITLPMPGGTESLNAAVTGSIMLYLASQKK